MTIADTLHEVTGKLAVDHRTREWCKLAYPDHPKGCPNYNKKETCPPLIPVIEDIFDLDRELWFIVVEFNLALQVIRMKQRHPNWSDRQARCVLYWQPKVNKVLGNLCRLWHTEKHWTIYTMCPEAMGVNVIKTCKRIGIPIKAKPDNTIYKVALLGYPIMR